MGINLTFYKVLAFVISAFFAGISGVLFSQIEAVGTVGAGYFSAGVYSFRVIIMVIIGRIISKETEKDHPRREHIRLDVLCVRDKARRPHLPSPSQFISRKGKGDQDGHYNPCQGYWQAVDIQILFS